MSDPIATLLIGAAIVAAVVAMLARLIPDEYDNALARRADPL